MQVRSSAETGGTWATGTRTNRGWQGRIRHSVCYFTNRLRNTNLKWKTIRKGFKWSHHPSLPPFYSPSVMLSLQIMNFVSRVFTVAAESYAGLFTLGTTFGAGFELFKVRTFIVDAVIDYDSTTYNHLYQIKFSFNGVNFYSAFKKNQLSKSLSRWLCKIWVNISYLSILNILSQTSYTC